MAEKKIQIRIDEALWLRLDDKRHQHRADWQEIGVKLWKAWLDDVATATTNPEPSGKHPEWHSKLDLVLDYGTEREKIGVQQYLEWASEHVARSPRKQRTGS